MTAALQTGLCSLFLVTLQITHASPTSEDFQFCHRAAAASLEHCLDKHPGSADQICWSDARTMKQRCYADINQKYAPPTADEKKKQEAARKAAAAAARKLQQESQ